MHTVWPPTRARETPLLRRISVSHPAPCPPPQSKENAPPEYLADVPPHQLLPEVPQDIEEQLVARVGQFREEVEEAKRRRLAQRPGPGPGGADAAVSAAVSARAELCPEPGQEATAGAVCAEPGKETAGAVCAEPGQEAAVSVENGVEATLGQADPLDEAEADAFAAIAVFSDSQKQSLGLGSQAAANQIQDPQPSNGGGAVPAEGMSVPPGRDLGGREDKDDEAALAEALALPSATTSSSGEWLLSIDAARVSNVARFINHSCSPNLIVQPVFARNARNALFYYISLFATEDIPAGTELTYSYGQFMSYVVDGNCLCGSAECLSNAAVGAAAGTVEAAEGAAETDSALQSAGVEEGAGAVEAAEAGSSCV